MAPTVNGVHVKQRSSCDEATPGIHKEQFQPYFAGNVSDDLGLEEQQKALGCLYEHEHVVVPDDNQSLGLTHVSEHTTLLKAAVRSKHQRPYHLAPDKETGFASSPG